MGIYSIGDVLSSHPKIINGCEEAVLVDFISTNSEPYSVLFFNSSSVEGYHFELDTRTKKMLDNAYLECITPHFCYIHNLYDIMKHYELFLLGMQETRSKMKILYLKSNKKYIQIFISNFDDFYKQLKEKGMFVYIYEADNFEDLKINDIGNFWSFRNKNQLKILPCEKDKKNIGIVAEIKESINLVNLFNIKHVKNDICNSGFKILNWNGFQLCDDFEDFKDKIKEEFLYERDV